MGIAKAACQASSKPGLGTLITGPIDALICTTAAAAATAAVASCPAISHVVLRPVLADAATLPSTSGRGLDFYTDKAGGEILSQMPNELKSISSVFHPMSMLGVFAKNIGFSALLRLNMYMLELLDHEGKALELEQQGQVAPPPPSFPKMAEPVQSGMWMSTREMAVRATRRLYEHLTVWRLGVKKASPFLRDGVQWISQVLVPLHALSSRRQQAKSYTFAMLHAHALLYAADCTVSVSLHVYNVARRSRGTTMQRATSMAKGASFHVLRCTILLVSTSIAAAIGSFSKPGIGTKVGYLCTDLAVNQAMFSLLGGSL